MRVTWEAVRDKAELPGLRLHDLRHAYASVLASGGLSLPIIGALLGHTTPTTTARYAHLLDDPLRQATEHVGSLWQALSDGTKGDVVPLRSGGQV
jgi:integrase